MILFVFVIRFALGRGALLGALCRWRGPLNLLTLRHLLSRLRLRVLDLLTLLHLLSLLGLFTLLGLVALLHLLTLLRLVALLDLFTLLGLVALLRLVSLLGLFALLRLVTLLRLLALLHLVSLLGLVSLLHLIAPLRLVSLLDLLALLSLFTLLGLVTRLGLLTGFRGWPCTSLRAGLLVIMQPRSWTRMREVAGALGGQDLRPAAVLLGVQLGQTARVLLLLHLHAGRGPVTLSHGATLFD
ncbi:MAG TPA: hypothetical protein VGV09_11350 [Steroidobacteraceae bacterium]|nr:hypothetical protein [Steroidobacteraceae bacterium]